jgi:hypothetical protein
MLFIFYIFALSFRNEIKTISFAKSSTGSVTEHLFSTNQLPQRLIVGLVLTEAVAGKLSKNPYDFQAFKLSKFSLSINNVALEYNTLNLNYNSKYHLAYQGLINALNLDTKTIGINFSNYLDGNVLYGFQIQSFESDSNFYPINGTLKLEIVRIKHVKIYMILTFN